MSSEIENFREYETPSGVKGNYWRIDDNKLTVCLKNKSVQGYVYLWESKDKYLEGDKHIFSMFFNVSLTSWSGASEQLCFSFWKAIKNHKLIADFDMETGEVTEWKDTIFSEGEGV